MDSMVYPSRILGGFVADLSYDALPPAVAARARELLIDWLGSALAGAGARPVRALEGFAAAMGPRDGGSTILVSGARTSSYFAAMVNGASSHVVEQDDVHNGSVFHPAAVVFPPVIALAEERGCSGRQVIEAVVAGYEVGIRIGEFLGRRHYEIFHTTGTAGTLAAAVAAGKLLGLDAGQLDHALGTAGTQAAGLWEFLRDAADSKQVHTAKAAADGLLSAVLAEAGVTGARRILEGAQGLAAGTAPGADPARLIDGLGRRWAILETSLKWHASCRHTHPAADALLQVMQRERLTASDIGTVVAQVHQAAINVLGPVRHPTTVHQSKFSMPTVLGLVAKYGYAGLAEFDASALTDPAVRAFEDRVRMALDPEVDAAYPKTWIGKVTVETTDGRTFAGRVDEPKGDPGNPLSEQEVLDKAMRLAAYRGTVPPEVMRTWIGRIQNIEAQNNLGFLFAR